MSETLLDPDVSLSDAERQTYLNDVLAETKRLDALIQELLDLTRLEADRASLHSERLDFAELVRNTVDRFEKPLRSAGVTLRAAGLDGPTFLQGDGRRLEQVVENLLMNARRYAPRNASVDVHLYASDDTATLVVADRVEVRNTVLALTEAQSDALDEVRRSSEESRAAFLESVASSEVEIEDIVVFHLQHRVETETAMRAVLTDAQWSLHEKLRGLRPALSPRHGRGDPPRRQLGRGDDCDAEGRPPFDRRGGRGRR